MTSKVKRQLTYLIQFIQIPGGERKLQLLACTSVILRFCYIRSKEVLSITGKKILLNKGVYTDKELNSLIGTELKSQMLDSSNDIQRTNKLVNGTKISITLKKLDNSDNLEDGNPATPYLHIL